MNIVIAAQLDAGALKYLSASHRVTHFEHAIEDWNAVACAEILVVRGHLKVDRTFLARAENLKLIVKAGAGLDNIDLGEASRRQISLVNTPASATAVAELSLLLLLAVRRRLVDLVEAVRADDWSAKYRFVGNDLRGSKIGIVGFGRIGQEMARIAYGLGMGVMVHDRSPERGDKPRAAREAGARFLPLNEILGAADALSLHVPLTPSSRAMIGETELARLSPHAVLINTARAGLVDRTALLRALRDRHIAGAGLDVFYEEPPHAADPLLSLPNVICTPHIGAQTAETHREIGRQVVAAIERYEQPELRAMPAGLMGGINGAGSRSNEPLGRVNGRGKQMAS